MNSILKKSLSFLMVFCMMFVAFAFTTKVNAATTYVQVTDYTSLNGDYLLVYVNGTNGYVFNATDAANGYASATVNGTTLTSSTDLSSCHVTITPVSGGYTLEHENGYMGGVSGSNTLKFTNTATTNTLDTTTKSGTVVFVSNSTGLVFNATNNNYRFRFYKNSTWSSNASYKGVLIFKEQTEVSTTPSITISSSVTNFYVGDDVNLDTSLSNIEGTPVWNSTDSEVATVVNGVLTAHKIGTTTITASIGDVTSNELEVKVYPSNKNNIKVAEALQVCELIGNAESPVMYTVIGTISTDVTYNTSYGSANFSLTDETGTIYVYGLPAASSTALQKGDKIAITAYLTTYNGTKQFTYTGTPSYVEYANIEYINDDAVYFSYEATVGTELVVPAAPTKEGFNFMGWYDAEEDGLEYDTTLPVSGNLTLYAKWVSNQVEVFTVTFDVNGGNGEYADQEVADGDYVVEIANPTRAYATFLGWSADGVNVWDFENDTVTEDITLVALWDVLADSVVEFVETETLATMNFSYNVSGEEVTPVAAEEVEPIAKFELGTDDSSKNEDNDSSSALTTYTEENNGYTLTLASLSKVYKGFDASGQAVLKLGTSSVVGSFSFTVADDVDYVIIEVAKYKNNTTKINVNGTDYTITTSSSTPDYTPIKVETTSTKTVSFATVSGGVRCKINSIAYYQDAPTATYEFGDVAMRFQGAIDADTYEALLAEGAEVTFGVVAAKVAKLNGQSLEEAIANKDANAQFIECEPELVEENGAYQFALLLSDIPAEGFAEEVAACAYVCVDGTYYFMSVKQFSVNSLAQYYVNNLANDAVVKKHLEALKALAKAN